jgi:hypothetical protein
MKSLFQVVRLNSHWLILASLLLVAVAIFCSSTYSSAMLEDQFNSVLLLSNHGIRVKTLPPMYISDSAKINHVFNIRNDIGRTVNFNSVKTSCGCTKAKLSKNTLASNEDCILELEMNLAGRRGPVSILATLPDKNGHQWQFKLETIVLQAVTVLPEPISPFIIDIGEKRELSLIVELAGNEKNRLPTLQSVRTVDDKANAIIVNKSEINTIYGESTRQQYSIDVLIKPAQVSGYAQTSVICAVFQDGKYFEYPINLNWRVKSNFTIIPSRAFFDLGKSSENYSESFIVKHSNKDTKVTAAETSLKDVKIDVIPEIGYTKIIVSLENMDHFDGARHGAIVLRTSDTNEPVIQIPCAIMGSSTR